MLWWCVVYVIHLKVAPTRYLGAWSMEIMLGQPFEYYDYYDYYDYDYDYYYRAWLIHCVWCTVLDWYTVLLTYSAWLCWSVLGISELHTCTCERPSHARLLDQSLPHDNPLSTLIPEQGTSTINIPSSTRGAIWSWECHSHGLSL